MNWVGASVPSLGDIAAWLVYHRNQPQAFILTTDTSWLLWKWPVKGHGKGGVEYPASEIAMLVKKLEENCFLPITAAGPLLAGWLPKRGFGIYKRPLASRTPEGHGTYHLWEAFVCSRNSECDLLDGHQAKCNMLHADQRGQQSVARKVRKIET
jgi:hypothetical protein